MYFHTAHELNHNIKLGVHFQDATSNVCVLEKDKDEICDLPTCLLNGILINLIYNH